VRETSSSLIACPNRSRRGFPAGLLAQVAVSKYADHLPLYRQEGIFRRHGVELPRQTMCDWNGRLCRLAGANLKLMHRLILAVESDPD